MEQGVQMKLNKVLLIMAGLFSQESLSADFDIGVNIEPAYSAAKPRRKNLPTLEKNRLKAKVAQRYDLPENWLNLMNQNQLYYLEIQERARDLDQNMIKPNANKLNKAKGE